MVIKNKSRNLQNTQIIDEIKGHMFDIKNRSDTRLARHFISPENATNPRITIHIMEYILTKGHMNVLTDIQMY